MNLIPAVVILLILARWAAQQWLERLSRSHVLKHSDEVPETFREFISGESYSRSVKYTLAKSKLQALEITYDALVLVAVLFSGVLPASLALFQNWLGQSDLMMAAWLFSIGAALSLTGLPWNWYYQFRLEEQFGFNTTTKKLWWVDRAKGLVIAAVIGYPLLLLLLKLANWMGPSWWLWAWGALLGFQLIMVVLAPILILPLFNKLTPLPEGSLRDRLLELADRIHFRARSIQVMDGSKRSRHSNAFFTGFGAFRKIVLFDTLIQQLSESELEAVLAHEAGHYRRKHIPKLIFFSALGSLGGFFALSVLARQDWFYAGFGFEPGHIGPAFLLFILLSGLVTFWFSPIAHAWSRKYEYEADAFAAEAIGQCEPLVSALRKLNKENLSNLTPHPVYSTFYYSHPTLLEREAALLNSAGTQQTAT
jgi:STE24 endopeptidase